ncbi:bifunctional tRNA (5-methylaminomethyl-2-thiouridine)(34)-methyltransferase MnmD/FAD-dependent 5-carboxymethylaminomethyl-2-thiouridine(34) oxidoreductase MnmC [Marinobacter adhaerens]|uniref:bifunctional tRNA (5-methylaminomethyl-2-thiouridine)(34)-methyltransferase MnmD/FAD-dependent 5-carboxymethylaminomethyl-2-thiouridine(34) oxidoreductase MnmC n=1 Tax=Marinobacter adhaerens TaxID=1033846 RepID=UPI001E5CCBD6|nr:bifunctional tRNA (5-methylaminomethyl-2-thiouridine)(34)-methyltransferase MnmD/FAD-dependent 5-carboxymethylaminomethyl-2-thiouridine(34) oxidoreductase MnmC [Marinobacter adhaerens]MCD1647441.1 bifunctional tRNA (5-methylaminomethyl-2-thiouridine)(34)-methyltransferase MnmD/FAD-dependent 5-carboxymethylaminomethyl-2-thiouridine(34) oxidoreductase MnmC [Marinobacter adhaerens]
MTRPPLPPAIEPAELVWHDGVPESKRFGDVYFSRDNGLEETRHVFLQHNQLPERFSQIPEGGSFVIAENGFGTGLNFLAAWQAWQGHAPAHTATLHFVSVERFPLTRQDLTRALALWPELKALADELLLHYPPLVRGVHRLVLAGGRVRLTLFFGDINDAWQSLDFHADAWFLDGFAPACNPDMWLENTICQVRAHSKPGTTLATFTSVGRIRRALMEAGFRMEKTSGYGRKREMLKGILEAERPVQPERTGTIAILGAGIAGCSLARNLAERGQPVTLVDTDGPGAGASGNAQGALYVKLGVEFNDQTELALTCLTFAQRFYGNWRGQYWHPTGLLQLAHSPQEEDRQARFLQRNDYPRDIFCPVNQEQASALAGVPTESGGLWFPRSGWLEPGNLCKALADHPLISTAFGVEVSRLLPCNGQWHISMAEGSPIVADQVIICSGHLSPELIPVKGRFRLKAIRGQVTHLPTSAIMSPKAVICGNRYMNPSLGDFAVTGATFDLHDNNPLPASGSHEENIREVGSMLPSLFSSNSDKPRCKDLEGRVAFRCTTHDYQPAAGPVFDGEGACLDDLYLFTGLGSKGLSYAPLLAEYLADQLTGQPVCLPANLVKRLETRRLYKTDMAVS